jgi:hypothetical protein
MLAESAVVRSGILRDKVAAVAADAARNRQDQAPERHD